MGFSRKRKGRDGKPRYTAYYRDLRGRERSAGTFARKQDSDNAWQDAEARVRAGVRHDPARGRQTFRDYVETTWLPNHRMEMSTREDYTSVIRRHIMPWFGEMKMRDIGPEQVREWITALRMCGTGPRRVEYAKTSVLGAIFTTAVHDGVLAVHPGHGVATDPVPTTPRKIITAAQFDSLYAHLPNSDAQLLVETAIETGLRWGELAELRVRDIDVAGLLTVSRAVVRVAKRNHPEGRRFFVKAYPKDREWRRFLLSEQIIRKLRAHILAYGLRDDDLLFARRGELAPCSPRPTVLPDPLTLGLTTPNEKGRRYRHGTTTAYGLGKCRCEHCRHAVTLYRRERRRNGKDRPATGSRDTGDLHISPNWFRDSVMAPALKTAGISGVTFHGLRHAHASWLLAGGADIQVVKERLGHAKISTTEQYLHTLPTADETALAALGKVRNGSADGNVELEAARKEIDELKAALVGLSLKLNEAR